MMVFTSIYGIVDGVFISNFVGTSAFAGVNLIMPVLMIIGSFGFMVGAGGSALVANTLGKGEDERANKIFTMLVIFTIILAVVLTLVVFFLMEEIVVWLGGANSTPQMIDNAIIYGKIITAFEIMYMLQSVFQSLFVVAERPMLGFIVTLIAGVTNMVLDAVFVAWFEWGVVGAALATGVSQTVGAVIPIIYFLRKNTSLLKFTKTKLEFKVLLKATTNGSSELLSNVAMSVISMLFNMQLLKVAGENGVAAYGIIMYAGFIFCAIFIGYSVGVAPVVGYHNGAKNRLELKSLLLKSLAIILAFSLAMVGLVEGLARPLSSIFTAGNKELLDLTTVGFRLYGISFGICGFNMLTSGFFTALNDGLTSAIISFTRTLVFQVICIMVMPLLWGLTGIWLSVVVAEALNLIVCFICLMVKRKKYGYL